MFRNIEYSLRHKLSFFKTAPVGLKMSELFKITFALRFWSASPDVAGKQAFQKLINAFGSFAPKLSSVSLATLFLIATVAAIFTAPQCSRAESDCDRIVSLAPSVTESLFDIGLGDRVVGVTRFCRYPKDALERPKIGGYLDLSLEAIVALKPTAIFALREHRGVVAPLARMGIKIHELDHSSLAGIKASYTEIGAVCGVAESAEKKLAEFARVERELASRCASVEGRRPKRIMVVVGRALEAGANPSVYISGRDGFYSELIGLIGGVNAHSGSTIAVPTLSKEGLMKLDPDVIFEVINRDDPVRATEAHKLWSGYQELSAVRERRVFILSDDFASIPGPRYTALAEKMAGLVCG